MDDGPSRTVRSEANLNTVSANTQVWELMFPKVPFEEACAAKFCCAPPSPRTSFGRSRPAADATHERAEQ